VVFEPTTGSTALGPLPFPFNGSNGTGIIMSDEYDQFMAVPQIADNGVVTVTYENFN
jgi:hypothetical protein